MIDSGGFSAVHPVLSMACLRGQEQASRPDATALQSCFKLSRLRLSWVGGHGTYINREADCNVMSQS